MADITITAANVAAQGGAATANGTAGASITAGQALSKNSSGNLVLASNTTAALAKVAGIALHAASSGQPIEYQTAGDIDIGATLTVGAHYVLSASGAISPVDDIASGDFASYIGYATAADNLRMGLLSATVAAAAAVV